MRPSKERETGYWQRRSGLKKFNGVALKIARKGRIKTGISHIHNNRFVIAVIFCIRLVTIQNFEFLIVL